MTADVTVDGAAAAVEGATVMVERAAVEIAAVTVEGAGVEATDGDEDGSSLGQDVMMTTSWLRAMFVALYAAIFLVGLSGNSLVVYVVSRSAAMRTITNIFIANLAVSDIMMCLLAVPFTPAAALLRSWPFGDVMCHVVPMTLGATRRGAARDRGGGVCCLRGVPMTLGVSVHVSTLTSIAIAVDRY